MPDQNTLLVPIALEALVVNERVRIKQNFRRFQMSYGSLEQYLSPEPDAFSAGNNDFPLFQKNEGVYLHWTLPDALRHGQSDDSSGNIEFPLVPNRWLVVRYNGPETNRTATAWVVESDYLDPNQGTSPFLDPWKRTETLIGRKLSLSSPTQWQETSSTAMFLTSVGTGDATFAAYQPNVDNVFSLHDPLTDQGILKDTLSYSVIGWYSDASKDPLANWQSDEELQAVLKSLDWSVAGDVSGQPKRTLYHGMVYGVNWDQQGDVPDSPRNDVNLTTAVGSTSVDALNALIEATAESDTDRMFASLLEAMQYNLLPSVLDVGVQDTLEERIHQSSFGSKPGGLVWAIVDREGIDPKERVEPTSEQLDLEQTWLSELNRKQSELDDQMFLLQSLQWELYGMWWKQGRANALNKLSGQMPYNSTAAQFKAALDPNDPNSLVSRVYKQLQLVQSLQVNVPMGDDGDALAASAQAYADRNGLSSQRELKASTKPRYWASQDPVVLFSGLPHVKPDPDSFYCRYEDQRVTGFTVEQNGTQTVISVEQTAALMPVLNLTNLPAGVDLLLQEFFLLDPTNATRIAQAVFQTGDSAVVTQITQAMTTRQSVTGVVPASGADRWEQPWAPLFIEWEVNWYTVPYEASPGVPNWQFNGSDYICTAQGDYSVKHQVVQGRTFLAPQAAFSFKSRVEQYIKEHPSVDVPAVRSFLRSVDDWNVLAQTLSGFHDQLAMRDLRMNLVPDDQNVLIAPDWTLAKLVQDQHHSVPNPGQAYKEKFKPMPPSPFQPMRSGQFSFQRLVIVDRFGQTIEVLVAEDEIGPTFHPVRSSEYTPEKPILTVEPERFVELRPRLLQEANLQFQFLSSEDDQAKLNLDKHVNPVCGWVLPNHLDQGLSVYDRDGHPLGELRLIKVTEQTQSLKWLAAPNSPIEQVENMQDNLLYRHLYPFLQNLIDAGAEGFTDLLQVIDDTLWTVDPLGEREDQNLSVLIGRPIAIVRAELQFELHGSPLSDPVWGSTFAQPAPALLNYPFSIRLGNMDLRRDGLLGYFVGEDYTRFNTVHTPDNPASGSKPYVIPIGEQDAQGQNYIDLTFGSDSSAAITMLMVPHALVHAYTGILPTKTLSLPSTFIENPLSKMEVTFFTGPLLTSVITGNPQQVQEGGPEQSVVINVPNLQNGTWYWTEKSGTGINDYSILQASQQDLPTMSPPTLREGRLRLVADLDKGASK